MTGYFTELFQYDFMRRAFLAILIITPLLGILGTMIVHKKMAYFSDALGHSAPVSYTHLTLPTKA